MRHYAFPYSAASATPHVWHRLRRVVWPRGGLVLSRCYTAIPISAALPVEGPDPLERSRSIGGSSPMCAPSGSSLIPSPQREAAAVSASTSREASTVTPTHATAPQDAQRTHSHLYHRQPSLAATMLYPAPSSLPSSAAAAAGHVSPVEEAVRVKESTRSASRMACVRVPRLLVFGGDVVSVTALEALHARMRCIVKEALRCSRRSRFGKQRGGLCSQPSAAAAGQTSSPFRAAQENEEEDEEEAAQVDAFVREHITVVCPALPKGMTPEEAARKFTRQYPVARYCVDNGLPIIPVDHPKSLKKSTLLKEMLRTVQGSSAAAAGAAASGDGLAAPPEKEPPTSVHRPEKNAAFTSHLPPHGLSASLRAHGRRFDASSSSTADASGKMKDKKKKNGTSHEEAEEHTWAAQGRPLDDYDLVVVVSFRYFLPQHLLRVLPPVINMHPSLLPRYRGASPIFSALRNNEKVGGVSIIQMKPEQAMDSGSILWQCEVPMTPDMDIRLYFPLVTQIGAAGLCDVIFGEAPMPTKDASHVHDRAAATAAASALAAAACVGAATAAAAATFALHGAPPPHALLQRAGGPLLSSTMAAAAAAAAAAGVTATALHRRSSDDANGRVASPASAAGEHMEGEDSRLSGVAGRTQGGSFSSRFELHLRRHAVQHEEGRDDEGAGNVVHTTTVQLNGYTNCHDGHNTRNGDAAVPSWVALRRSSLMPVVHRSAQHATARLPFIAQDRERLAPYVERPELSVFSSIITTQSTHDGATAASFSVSNSARAVDGDQQDGQERNAAPLESQKASACACDDHSDSREAAEEEEKGDSDVTLHRCRHWMMLCRGSTHVTPEAVHAASKAHRALFFQNLETASALASPAAGKRKHAPVNKKQVSPTAAAELEISTAMKCAEVFPKSVLSSHCDWPDSFTYSWKFAQLQEYRTFSHFKDDPYHAPLLPKDTAVLRFSAYTAMEAFGVWRAFVGGDYFQPSVNATLDKSGSPVRNQLVHRAVRRLLRERAKSQQHPKKAKPSPQTQRSGAAASPAVVAVAGESDETPVGIVVGKHVDLDVFHPAGLQLLAEAENTLRIPCTFTQVTNPTLVPRCVREELAEVESGDLQQMHASPTATNAAGVRRVRFYRAPPAIFRSLLSSKATMEESEADVQRRRRSVQRGDKSKPDGPTTTTPANEAVSKKAGKEAAAESNKGAVASHSQPDEPAEDEEAPEDYVPDVIHAAPPTQHRWHIPPGTGYFPTSDESYGAIKCREGWFLWKEAHMKWSNKAQPAVLIRKGLAMKTGVLYVGLFSEYS